MKISQQDYDILQHAIFHAGTLSHLTQEDYKTMGLDEAMYRWDLLWHAEPLLPPDFIRDGLFSYMNHIHIDTALRHVVKALRAQQRSSQYART